MQAGDFLQCVNEQAGADITRNLPADSDVPPAVNPILEQKARNSSVNTGINEINYEKVPRARLRNKMSFFLCAKSGISSVFGKISPSRSPLEFAYFCCRVLNLKSRFRDARIMMNV